jgi:lipid A 3-O-deacylase
VADRRLAFFADWRSARGTAFQFVDMAGVGMQFGSRQQYLAGYRFQHISNGGINEPNPGINFSQLYLQYNF